MRPGPVIEAELRQWSRRPWLTWSRVAAAGPLLALLMGMGTARGTGVGIGKDHTLFALTDGRVEFRDGKLGRKYVHVAANDIAMAEPVAAE